MRGQGDTTFIPISPVDIDVMVSEEQHKEKAKIAFGMDMISDDVEKDDKN